MVSIREKVSLAGIVEVDGEPYRLTRNPETDEPLFNASLETDKAETQQEFREHAGFGPDGLGGSLPLSEGQMHYAEGCDPSERGLLKAGLLYEGMGLSLPGPVTKLVVALPSTGGGGTTDTNPTGSLGAANDAAWTNPTNITAEDGSVASVTLDSGETAGELKAAAWGFALSDDPTGYTVQVKTRYTGDAGVGSTMTAQLQNQSGALVGPTVTKPIPDTLEYISFPFAANGLSAANVNDADFGVRLTADFLAAGGAGAGTQTKLTAGTVAAVASANPDWTNPANAGTVDSVYAVTAVLNGTSTGATNRSPDNLDLTNWSFAVPTGVTPDELAIAVTGYVTKSGFIGISYQVQLQAQLIIGGTPTGNTVTLGTISSTAPQTVSNGGSLASVWGVSLSEAQLENANFGVRLTVTSTGQAAVIFSLDGAAITVDYTGSATPGSGTVEVDHVTMTVETGGSGPASGDVLLYAASENTLTKVSLNTVGGLPSVTLQNTKTFTHGDDGSPPSITDVIVLKDGDNPGNAAGLVGFGGEAQLQQIDDMPATGADTYGTLEATDKAYAGVFGFSMNAEGVERLVWKSTGTDGQSGGHFARIQNAPVEVTDNDYTHFDTWNPITPLFVGDFGTTIHRIEEFQTGIAVSKPEGVYQFNDQGNSYFLYGLRATRATENGNDLLAWGTGLLIGTARDLARLPEDQGVTWGISRLISNQSEVQGFPTAFAAYGDDIFLAYYDGVDSHILRATMRTTARVPHPLVFYPEKRVENYRVNSLAVFADAQGSVWFAYPGLKEGSSTLSDIYYTLRAPDPVKRYAASGSLETTIQGTTDVASKIERVIAYTRNVGAGLGRWRISVSMDYADYEVIGDWIETEGRSEQVPSGIDDEGHLYRFRYEFENDVPSNCPTLVGVADTPGEPGGVAIEGKRLEEPAFRFEFLTTIKDEDRGPVGQLLPGSVATRANFLFDRSRTYVTLAADEWPFETVPLTVFIESVTMAMGEKDIPDTRDLKLRVKGRAKAGVRG